MFSANTRPAIAACLFGSAEGSVRTPDDRLQTSLPRRRGILAPSDLTVTDSAARFVGWHVITVVALDQDGEMRV